LEHEVLLMEQGAGYYPQYLVDLYRENPALLMFTKEEWTKFHFYLSDLERRESWGSDEPDEEVDGYLKMLFEEEK
jgi:hypothetical protein